MSYKDIPIPLQSRETSGLMLIDSFWFTFTKKIPYWLEMVKVTTYFIFNIWSRLIDSVIPSQRKHLPDKLYGIAWPSSVENCRGYWGLFMSSVPLPFSRVSFNSQISTDFFSIPICYVVRAKGIYYVAPLHSLNA